MTAPDYEVPVGPLCRCGRTEQDCARTYPCCPSCDHFPEPRRAHRRQPQFVLELAVCDDPKAGTDTGYYRHVRQSRTRACRACRQAHAVAERARQARKRAVW